MKKAILLLALTAAAWGHDYWLKPTGPQRVLLQYGHEGSGDAYSAKVLTKVSAYDAAGAPVPASSQQEDGRCVLTADPSAAQLVAEVDTGYWTKSVRGWANKSKREAGYALLSEWSLYYNKVLLNPGATLNRPLGHPLEFVPVAIDASAGRFRLLLRGQPLADTPVYNGHRKVGQTDAAGEVALPREPLMVLSASHKEPLAGNPDADRLHLHAVLTVP